MDILISSNLERLLSELCGHDDERVRGYMSMLADSGEYTVGSDVLKKLQSEFSAGSADDERTFATIRRVFEDRGYLLDTHTAVAVSVYDDYIKENGRGAAAVIDATASPFKFAGSVLPAIGGEKCQDDFAMLDALAQRSGIEIPAPLTELRSRTERFTQVIGPDGMKSAVADWLGKKAY